MIKRELHSLPCHILCEQKHFLNQRVLSDSTVSPELLFANHFSQVLDDKLSGTKGLLGADAPALALGTEPLQTLDPVVSLDVLVVTLVTRWTGAGRALCITHPGEIGNVKNLGNLMGKLFKSCHSKFCRYLFRHSSRQPFSVESSRCLQLQVVVS